eukprot:gene5902-4217_t
MWSWVCLGGWCGPSLMLSKLGMRPPSALTPFDMVRCTWDGLIDMVGSGFQPGKYLPHPSAESASSSSPRFLPDPVFIWLLFRSQHACFTHFDLNRPDALEEIQRRIDHWDELLSPAPQSSAPRRLTFLRTVVAENPAEELELVPQFHAAVRRRSLPSSSFNFRTVMILHDQEDVTRPVCSFPAEAEQFGNPCVVWNLRRERMNDKNPGGGASPSLFDQCHAGYEEILQRMSTPQAWEHLPELSYEAYTEERRRRRPAGSSLFTPYTELCQIHGVPATRGTCTGFGSTKSMVDHVSPCLHCGSTDGHALNDPERFDTGRPWSEADVQELLLSLVMGGGDEVAAVEEVAARQQRGANETWRQLQHLLGKMRAGARLESDENLLFAYSQPLKEFLSRPSLGMRSLRIGGKAGTLTRCWENLSLAFSELQATLLLVSRVDVTALRIHRLFFSHPAYGSAIANTRGVLQKETQQIFVLQEQTNPNKTLKIVLSDPIYYFTILLLSVVDHLLFISGIDRLSLSFFCVNLPVDSRDHLSTLIPEPSGAPSSAGRTNRPRHTRSEVIRSSRTGERRFLVHSARKAVPCKFTPPSSGIMSRPDSTVSSAAFRPPRPACSAWLEKQAEWRPSWDARFVTLDGCRLEYRVSQAAAPKKSGTVVSLETDAPNLVLRVYLLEGGSWTLRAKTKQDYDKWAKLFTMAVQPPPPGGPSGNSFTAEAEAAEEPGRAAGSQLVSPTRRSEGGTRNWDIPQHPSEVMSTHSSNRTRHTDPHGESPHEVLLTAVVEKQAAWTMKWNPRVIELREGCQLVYRPVNGDARQRYFLVGADRSGERHHETHVLFSTSGGEDFWVNFTSVEESEQWVTTVREVMKANTPWHWFPIKSMGPSDNLGGGRGGFASIFGRLMEKRAATTVPLHVHYHCSSLLLDGPTAPSILVFGGATNWTGVSTQKKWAVPMCSLQQLTNACISLSLRGNLKATVLDVEPFPEHLSVKVKAPKLLGATLTTITLDVSAYALGTTEHDPQATKSQIFSVVVGGISGIPQLLEETEVWAVGFPSAALPNRAAGPVWRKWVVPSHELPPRAFHTAVRLGYPPVPLNNAETENLAKEWVLIAGGVDHELQPVADAFLLSWRRVTAPGPVKERIIAQRLCSLPEPRAFHGCAVLSNGTVVVVGGRGKNKALAHAIVALRCSAGEAVWQPVQWASDPIPFMLEVAVDVTPSGQSVVALAQVPSGAAADPQYGVRLYVIHFECGGGSVEVTASWEEIPVRMGMVPKRVTGTSIHVHEGYVYVLGAGQLTEDLHPTLCGPLRVLMG